MPLDSNFERDYTYEPRIQTPSERYNSRLLREQDEIEDALRGDITLAVEKYNTLLTKLLSLIKK